MSSFTDFTSRDATLEKMAGVAIIAGLLSACLISLLTSEILTRLFGYAPNWSAVKFGLFIKAWGLSTSLLLFFSKTLTELIAKSFLLGSVEWSVAAFTSLLFFQGKPYFGASMSLCCLIGFGITQLRRAQINGTHTVSTESAPQLQL
jgi:hypothetical protein